MTCDLLFVSYNYYTCLLILAPIRRCRQWKWRMDRKFIDHVQVEKYLTYSADKAISAGSIPIGWKSSLILALDHHSISNMAAVDRHAWSDLETGTCAPIPDEKRLGWFWWRLARNVFGKWSTCKLNSWHLTIFNLSNVSRALRGTDIAN